MNGCVKVKLETDELSALCWNQVKQQHRLADSNQRNYFNRDFKEFKEST